MSFFCGNFVHHIITENYGEDEWKSDMVKFLVWHTYPPLVIFPWHIFFTWFVTRTTSAPHVLLYSSTTLFPSSLFTRFLITSDSWGPHLGYLQHICVWLPVSIWNEKNQIGQSNPSSQNTYRYSVTTSLILYCKSLGPPCSFRFFYNSFVSVLTSNFITSYLGGRVSCDLFKDLT